MKEIRSLVGHTLLQMPSVTVINFDESGRALMVKHADTGLWVAPGGAIEPGESPAASAVREMWEETGLEVELTGIIGVYGGPEFVVEYSNGDRTSYVAVAYEARVTGGTLGPIDDESSDAGYFTLNEILGMKTQPWVPVVLPDAFAHRDRPLK